MDDKMVINLAFLINKSRQKEFYRKIENLNNEFAEKLNFKCVGLLPPYSFYTIEIEKIKFNEANWARKKLCILDDATSKYEIKKAYQRLALFYHPDKNPDTPGIAKEFDEINKAYKILVNYCQACEQAGKTKRCSFKEEEFKKNAVFVKVKE